MSRWTEDSIAYALATRVFPWRQYVVVPNVDWGLLTHEADLVALSDSGWLSEIEIKISAADYRADASKPKHALAVSTPGHSPIINRFYYAMPDSVYEKIAPVPAGYGCIVLTESGRAYKIIEAERRHGTRKLTEEERMKLMRLGYHRYWTRAQKVARLIAAQEAP